MATHHGQDGSWVSLSLEHVPTSTRLARASLRSGLASLDLRPEFIADAEIVMSELVANAAEHGRPDRDGMIEAAWRLTTDRLLIRVRDSGTTDRLEAGSLDHEDEPPLRGRGLGLIAALTSDWSHESLDDGTQVTAVLMRPQA